MGFMMLRPPLTAARLPRPRVGAVLVAPGKRARLASVVLAAAAGASSPPPTPPTAAERARREADGLLAALPELTLPSRHQPAVLPRERLRALRAESEELAKSKRLSRMQIGVKGLTKQVVAAAAGALAGAPGGLLRVKLGEGCGLERRSAAAAMERLLDAVCVKQVGFCVTLYREPGLPRQDNNLPRQERDETEEATPASGAAAAAAAATAAPAKPKNRKERAAAKVERAAARRSSEPASPPKPPAFTVV